jgi:hypothetical protein
VCWMKRAWRWKKTGFARLWLELRGDSRESPSCESSCKQALSASAPSVAGFALWIVNTPAGDGRAAQGELVHNQDTSMRVLSLDRAGVSPERTGVFTSGIV